MTDIQAAAESLRAGSLVVMPTDTVYGIASLPTDGAVKSIFEAKGRPPDRPLPILAASTDDLSQIVRMSNAARRLAEVFWPGPLSMVLARDEGFTAYLGEGGEQTVAVRVPDHPLAIELLSATGPLAVTSANRSDENSATTIDEARASFGERVQTYLDGGTCDGPASTIIELVSGPRILRRGPLEQSRIDQTLMS